MATTSTHVVGPLTIDTVKYNPIKDFEHIGMIAETPYVLVVSPKLAVNSVKELIDYAKKNPGKLNYGSAGEGSTTHLAALMFLDATGTKMEHIPYKSNADSTKAVMTDEVQVLFGSMPAVLGQIKAGTIKALAVGSTTRSPELPDVITMQDAGVPGYRATLWLGLSAPAKTPANVVSRLNAALDQALSDPAVAKRLSAAGAEPSKMTPAEFSKLIANEMERLRQDRGRHEEEMTAPPISKAPMAATPNTGFVFQPVEAPSLPVRGSALRFPVHRIYCIGRNYEAHAVEMGHDPSKEPPFFFQKNPTTSSAAGTSLIPRKPRTSITRSRWSPRCRRAGRTSPSPTRSAMSSATAWAST